MSPTIRRSLGAVLAVTLLCAACSDDEDAGTADPGPTATTAAPTAVPPTTAPTVTTAAPVTTATDGVEGEADGAGCTPEGDTLADGRWFGFVSSPTASGFAFDLACWFSGEAAITAAAEDGAESPPPNDYYIRNDNPRLRTLTLAGVDIPVSWVRETGDPTTQVETPYGEWVQARAGGMVFGVWVEVRGGQVARISEQWVP